MRCPACKNKIIQKKEGWTKLRIQGPISFDESLQAHAQCYWCKEDILLPVTLQYEHPTQKFIIPRKIQTNG
jgi:hypothetical protein